MLNNGNKSNCGLVDEIVSYLYDETGEAERKIFEAHLADCGKCTDEFAAISNSRLSVFEWRKEEFAHLPTPEIAIPYRAKQRITEADESIGFLSGLRGLFSLSSWPLASAVVLAICLGLGFLAIKYVGTSYHQIAVTEIDQTVPSITSPNHSPPQVISDPATENVDVKTASDNTVPRPVRASTDARRKPVRRVPPAQKSDDDVAIQQNQTPQVQKAPVLTNYEDDNDATLRLTDLFEEGGT